MIPGYDRDEYLRLVTAFPPVKVSDDDQAAATEARIDALLAQTRPSAAARAYLDLLSDLLADWEDAKDNIADIHGAELVKTLLKERGLRQRDLVGVFPTESIVSEVLSGHRELTREHVEALANFFHVSPAVFFPASTGRAAGVSEIKRLARPDGHTHITAPATKARSLR